MGNNVNEWWAFFFVVYKCSIGFAVVQVITSVFIQQTFKVASRDEEVMIADKKAEAKAYITNIEHLFDAMDDSHDGVLTHEEFTVVMEDRRVRTWFDAIGVDMEASALFSLLDEDQDGVVEK